MISPITEVKVFMQDLYEPYPRRLASQVPYILPDVFKCSGVNFNGHGIMTFKFTHYGDDGNIVVSEGGKAFIEYVERYREALSDRDKVWPSINYILYDDGKHVYYPVQHHDRLDQGLTVCMTEDNIAVKIILRPLSTRGPIRFVGDEGNWYNRMIALLEDLCGCSIDKIGHGEFYYVDGV